MIVTRAVFQTKFGKQGELVQALLEARSLWHAARIMTDMSGSYSTVIVESELESLAAWEAMMQDSAGAPRFKALFERMTALVESGRREIFSLVE